MKGINTYINEKLVLNKSNVKDYANHYNYHPKDRDELRKLIYKLIKERGLKADLNDIDTSKISDMTGLFFGSNFNGDISSWDVSNVKNMESMFERSNFNGDISKWDVSNVKTMCGMFFGAHFNKDISSWDVSNVENMDFMFRYSALENNPPAWYKK